MSSKKSDSNFWVLDGVVKDFTTKEDMQFFLDESGLTIMDGDKTRQVVKISSLTGGMSDAAIETTNNESDSMDSEAKPFRYKPTAITSQIIARTNSKSGLTSQEVVTIALMLLQDASLVEMQRAVNAILQDRAQALFDSLK